jgi:hypothetical protein
MNALGPYKKNSIAYSSIMASGKSDWMTMEEVTDTMNSFLRYDTVEVSPSPSTKIEGTVWHGFRLKAFKEGKPERTMILDGEEETLMAKEALYVDTLYYFHNKYTFQYIFDYWTKNECAE